MSEIDEKEIERRFEAISKFELDPEITTRDIERTRQTLTGLISKQQTIPGGIWRMIMKNTFVRIAAGVAVIAAVLIGVHFAGNPFGTTPTFAQVIRPILHAHTAVFDIVIGDEAADVPVIHDMVMGSRIRRTVSIAQDVVSIIDLETGKILTLDSKKQEAVYIDLKGLPPIPNYMERLRNLVAKLQQVPEFTVEELGEQEIAGQKLIGFRAKHPKSEITIWADRTTALPVRIEQVEGQMKTICRNVVFDVPMDEKLFSMDVPEGYKQQQTQLDLQGATEEDFIEGLRIRAEVFGDGWLPEGVAVEDYLKQAPAMQKKFEEMALPDDKATELGMKMSRHLLFIRFFKGQGQWHYAGQGVKLGDGSKPIFWYQPQGSQTWRVIYGDLTVRDVAPENLPQ
jgi:hypothetical protein